MRCACTSIGAIFSLILASCGGGDGVSDSATFDFHGVEIGSDTVGAVGEVTINDAHYSRFALPYFNCDRGNSEFHLWAPDARFSLIGVAERLPSLGQAAEYSLDGSGGGTWETESGTLTARSGFISLVLVNDHELEGSFLMEATPVGAVEGPTQRVEGVIDTLYMNQCQ
jgi:hypothetical protein